MTTKIIDGKVYCINSAGSLVPEESVRDIDKLRDNVVCTIAEKIRSLEESMKAIKAACMSDIDEFMKISAERYGIRIGGAKGNVQLSSFDGNVQILVMQSNALEVDEGIALAKELIDEYLTELTSGASPELRTIVGQAFRVKQGRMDVKRLMELKQLRIQDPRWQKAMEIIADSVNVTSTKPCLRLRDRDNEGVFKTHSLEFSTI